MARFSVFLMVCLPMLAYAQWVKEQENEGMYEGDMILTPEQIQDLKAGIYQFGTKKKNLWPRSGKYVYVPYEIDPNHPRASELRNVIQKAVNDYQAKTCIRLIKRTNQRAYLHFYNGGGCSSPVGYWNRKNSISLPSGCWRHGTVLHEIAHSLGVYHEQSRPDRDSHVEIMWNNITPSGAKGNFYKQTYASVDSLNTPYDFKSMMHYSATAFGKGKITIRTKDPKNRYVIGQRTGFSEIDVEQLNKLYCGGSTGGSTCTETDKHSSCSGWKTYCNSNTYVKTNCKKTCQC